MVTVRSLSRLRLPLTVLVSWACAGGDLSLPSDTAAQIEVVQGSGQTGLPGARLASPLIVRLLDEAGNGIPGRAVVWTVSAGGGTIEPATSTTDAEGFASTEWTLGEATGPNRATAQVPGVGMVIFTATGDDDDGAGGEPSAGRSTISAEPASIEVGTGSSTITVTVLDEAGDPVEGATVALQATGGGNTLTQPTTPTGADGVVTGTLESTTPGEKVVSATVDGSVELSRTAQVTVTSAPAGEVDRLVYLVPPGDVEENETFSVEVALVDEDGSVVSLSGIFIYLGLFPEGREAPANDLLQGERFENTEDGIAVFELAVEKKGRYRLRALTDDLPELGPQGPEPYLFSELFEVE
jgi:Big-like domain-containing protein